jgi:hypothetical protein
MPNEAVFRGAVRMGLWGVSLGFNEQANTY